MANDIFAGLYADIFFSESIENQNINGPDFTKIKELSVWPETGIERSSIEVPNFSSPISRKLVGRASIPDVSFSVNYIPGETTHEALRAMAETGSRGQFKIVYWTDETLTLGVAKVFNGFITNSGFTGGSDAAVTLNFTLTVDKQVATGVIDNTLTPPSSGSGAGSNP
ncbi:phage tail tube protein [Atlantibacter hermannii]|uniref:phage tail tube protein n=1 Tax=Atlantibacter hermannii TaxID=565 RepID=UPI0028AE5BED|nr:phage tail tube protein [Atlantibacter hermannii]